MNHGARTFRSSPTARLLIVMAAAVAEIMMYAIAQKEQMGLDKAVEECSAPIPSIADIAPFADSCLRAIQSTGCRATA